MDPIVLPHNKLVFFEILNVFQWGCRLDLEHKPSNVSPKESLCYVVGIVIGIDVLMVLAVFRAPPKGGVLESRGSEKEDEKLDGPLRFEGFV